MIVIAPDATVSRCSDAPPRASAAERVTWSRDGSSHGLGAHDRRLYHFTVPRVEL
jgi:hypothetical protein